LHIVHFFEFDCILFKCIQPYPLSFNGILTGAQPLSIYSNISLSSAFASAPRCHPHLYQTPARVLHQTTALTRLSIRIPFSPSSGLLLIHRKPSSLSTQSPELYHALHFRPGVVPSPQASSFGQRLGIYEAPPNSELRLSRLDAFDETRAAFAHLPEEHLHDGPAEARSFACSFQASHLPFNLVSCGSFHWGSYYLCGATPSPLHMNATSRHFGSTFRV
jgi:hypothetical protein